MFSIRLRRNLSRRWPAASSVTLKSSLICGARSFRLRLGEIGDPPGAVGLARKAKVRQPLQLAAALRADVQLVVGLALPALAGERLARIVDAHLAQRHSALAAASLGGERKLVLQAHLRHAGGQRQRRVLIRFDVVLVDELIGDPRRILHAAAGEARARCEEQSSRAQSVAHGGRSAVEALAVHLESILSAGRRRSLAKIYTKLGDDGSTG